MIAYRLVYIFMCIVREFKDRMQYSNDVTSRIIVNNINTGHI